MLPRWQAQHSPKHSRENAHWVRCAITSLERTPAITSRPTSPLICCRRWMNPRARNCGVIRKHVMQRSAAERWRAWKCFFTRMSELAHHIDRFLQELRRNNVSVHTLESYGSDLRQFLEYFSSNGLEPPAVAEFDILRIREWLGALHSRELDALSIRRKLAALRTFFGFLLREGTIAVNPARLVRTPKAPKRLPTVMTPEQVNGLIDAVAGRRVERPYP